MKKWKIGLTVVSAALVYTLTTSYYRTPRDYDKVYVHWPEFLLVAKRKGGDKYEVIDLFMNRERAYATLKQHPTYAALVTTSITDGYDFALPIESLAQINSDISGARCAVAATQNSPIVRVTNKAARDEEEIHIFQYEIHNGQPTTLRMGDETMAVTLLALTNAFLVACATYAIWTSVTFSKALFRKLRRLSDHHARGNSD